MVGRAVILDSGPLGLVTNPKPSPQSVACSDWLKRLVAVGTRIIIPEIADYEIRRELIRANKYQGISRLDSLHRGCEYLPITTEAMRQAANLWAQARQHGQPTAGDNTIDGDVILAAQALTCGHAEFVVATTNLKHLSKLVAASLWPDISPHMEFETP